MAKMNHIIFCVLGLSIILSGSAQNLRGNRRNEAKVVTESEREIWNVAANLYKGANKPEVENVIFSPLSLTTAMVMLNSGAGGETAREIQSLFKFGTNSEFTIQNQTQILKSLTNQASEKQPQAEFVTASRIYANSKTANLCETFVRAVSSLGDVKTLDFSDPKPVVAEINDWVNNQTQGKISKIVEERDFDGETAAVLLNTLYFKALWKTPFNQRNTKAADFHVSENQKVQVEMMSMSGQFPYVDLQEVEATAVFLPYKGDRFSMVIYLPKVGRNLSTLEEKLETLVPSQVRNEAETETIALYLPKFNISSSLDFKEILTSLGVRKMFGGADFSRMSKKGGLSVSEVRQNIFIQVNEKGTEAAAVTVVLMPRSFARNRVKVDRPFIFQIYDSVTGVVLFSGRISNPNPNPKPPVDVDDVSAEKIDPVPTSTDESRSKNTWNFLSDSVNSAIGGFINLFIIIF